MNREAETFKEIISGGGITNNDASTLLYVCFSIILENQSLNILILDSDSTSPPMLFQQ